MLTTHEKVYEYIRLWTEEYGYPPTMREIATGLHIKSPNTVLYNIRRLVADGKITYVPGSPRTLQIVYGDPAK